MDAIRFRQHVPRKRWGHSSLMRSEVGGVIMPWPDAVVDLTGRMPISISRTRPWEHGFLRRGGRRLKSKKA